MTTAELYAGCHAHAALRLSYRGAKRRGHAAIRHAHEAWAWHPAPRATHPGVMAMVLIQLATRSEFDSFIKEKPVAVVYCWASWIERYDADYRPIIARALEEFTDRINVGLIDFDDEGTWDILREHRVTSIPALLFYKDGQWVKKLIGVRSHADIAAVVRGLLEG
jgi:thioredoxin 1